MEGSVKKYKDKGEEARGQVKQVDCESSTLGYHVCTVCACRLALMMLLCTNMRCLRLDGAISGMERWRVCVSITTVFQPIFIKNKPLREVEKGAFRSGSLHL